ncbi:MAG: ABC transporter substrate-binding protein [Dehalococcoidia bacterium]|nr:ABC transporter substrate-binding protein [Dehalococcoidia bacterium]
MGTDNSDQIWERPLTRRQLMSAMTVGVGAMALVGCGNDDEGSAGGAGQISQTTTKQPKKGGAITLLEAGTVSSAGGASILDPHKTISISYGSSDAWGLINVPLVRYDWTKGTVVDGIAEKWEFTDPTTLVLSLKKGIHFQQGDASKGREIDSGDVVASLERVRTKGDATFTIANRFRNVDTYAAVDKYTVRVKFLKPDANFLSWAYHPNGGHIMSREKIEKYGANMTVPEAWTGSGPFIPDLSTYKDTISVTLRRNPNYDVDPGGLPYLDAITILGIGDRSLMDAAIRSNQIDVGLIQTLSAKSFEGNFNVSSTQDTITAASHLSFNTAMAPFNDPRVRQAFHRALDRVELNNVVGDGFGCVSMLLGCRSASYLTEKNWAGKPGFRTDHKQDLEEAKKLLAAAGVDPTKLQLTHRHDRLGGNKVRADQGIAITGMLQRDLGVKITDYTENARGASDPGPDEAKSIPLHMTTFSHGGQAGLILDDPLFLGIHSTAVSNSAVWFDKKTDDLIDKQAATLDLNERKKLWAELQTYLVDPIETAATMPFSPITRSFDFFVSNKKLQNWTTPGYFLSHYPWQYNKVWLDA